MPIRLSRFEMPKGVQKDETTATATYTRFVAEPFEIGYARTIGNSLRRVLLSSIEGAAITSVKIEGVSHEFSTIRGCAEDVADIVLNLKKVLLKTFTREPQTISLKAKGPCTVTAASFAEANSIEVLNPAQEICTLDVDGEIEMACEVKTGRGFCLADANKKPDQEIGRIAIDSIFPPVTRVNCLVENNAGSGYEIYLNALNESSAPVSITFENCRSVGNRSSASVCGGNGRTEKFVKGFVRFVNCTFEGARGSGISVTSKPAKAFAVSFKDCVVSNAAGRDVSFGVGRFRQGAPDGIRLENLTVFQPPNR